MRPEQHPASNSTARKARAEATNPHGGCKVGQCKAEDQWRSVSCAGGGGDVDALAEALCKAICDLLGEPRILVPGEVLALLSRPPVGDLLAAALAAQPAAPQPTEGGALTEAEREALEGAFRQAAWLEAETGVHEWAAFEGDAIRALVPAVERILAARSQRPEGVTVTGALAAVARVEALAEEWERHTDAIAITYQDADRRRQVTAGQRRNIADLRAALRPEGGNQ